MLVYVGFVVIRAFASSEARRDGWCGVGVATARVGRLTSRVRSLAAIKAPLAPTCHQGGRHFR